MRGSEKDDEKKALCDDKRNGTEWNTLSEHIYIINKHTRMFQVMDI